MSRAQSYPGERLHPDPFFSGIAGYFAGFINRLAVKATPELELAAALVSSRTAAGHICLDLAGVAGRPLSPLITGENEQILATIRCPELSSWREQLLHSGVVGRPGEQTPLILSPQDRLYLHRFWEYEKTVADWIHLRCRDRLPIDLEKLAQDLARLFPDSSSSAGIDWQKIAAIVAVTRSFAVVTGGPGTGKTSTVARILALICQQNRPSLPKILLAAPTGKAAARLQEAITRARAAMSDDPEIIAAIPDRAMTIHRLLAPRGTTYRSKSDNPLAADLVVVDEASMVDLPLMARLVRALPAEGRLILLGDRNQLSSVEPGSILGDICRPDALASFSTGFRNLVAALTSDRLPENQQGQVNAPLADTIVELQKSFRFREESGIRLVSSAVRHNDADGLIKALQQDDLPDITWRPVPDTTGLGREVGLQLDRHGLDFLRCDSPEGAFAALGRFRILCALRHGPYGVLAINTLVEKHLARAGLIPRPDNSGNRSSVGPDYCGRPLMITRNDYGTGLFNGDTGILLPDPEDRDRLRAFFQNPDGTVRTLSPRHLPCHETVHAITVHKSQGSEFDRILLILPPAMSPVLTRELLYTALTRAKTALELWATEEVLRATITSPITRDSGLMDALWGIRRQMTDDR